MRIHNSLILSSKIRAYINPIVIIRWKALVRRVETHSKKGEYRRRGTVRSATRQIVTTQLLMGGPFDQVVSSPNYPLYLTPYRHHPTPRTQNTLTCFSYTQCELVITWYESPRVKMHYRAENNPPNDPHKTLKRHKTHICFLCFRINGVASYLGYIRS